jgi:RNA polymerase sigma-70 factor (ECF subfamily)
MDSRLVVQAQEGDEAAFAELTNAIGDRLYRVAFGILREAAQAEDATQHALVEVWRHLPQLRDPDRFDAWAYRTLVRSCHRERRRTPFVAALTVQYEPAAPDELRSVNDRDQLERGFRRLSVDQRAVVVLHHYLGLTLEEVADTLGIPVGTVNSRLGRAMTKLRQALHIDGVTVGVREVLP